MTFRYDPKVSKCQKNLIEMPKYRNVRNGVSKCQNGVSKCQKYPNTQKCIEISNLDCIEMSKDLNIKFRCIEMSKVSKCQFF